MERGGRGGRAAVMAVAGLLLAVASVPAVPAGAAEPTGAPAPAGSPLRSGSADGAVRGAGVDATVPPDPRRDPVGALEWELARADDPDGYLLVLAEATPLEHLWSLLRTLRPVDVQARAADLVTAADGRVEASFEGVGQLLADLDADAARRLAADPAVVSVSPNGRARATVRTSTVQTGTPFIPTGLELLDHVSGSILDDEYRWTSDGTGVEVYVFDTGIEADHPELSGRVPAEPSGGWFRIDAEETPDDDCNGHGTHVAGTIAGVLSGVAKGAEVIPVKVFPDCAIGGFVSDIIAAIEWLEGEYPEAGVDRPIVANMSLGAGASSALDAAVQRLIDDGVHVVVAAGNDGAPVANYSPARVADAITVGATGYVSGGVNYVLQEAAYSNYGAGVDLFALGTGVASACSTANALGENDGQGTCTDITVDGTAHPLIAISGTSMATPHVAGAVARHVGAAYAADGTLVTPAAATTALLDGAADLVTLLTPDAPGTWSTLLLNTMTLEPDAPSPTDPTPYPVVAPCTAGTGASSLGQLVGGAAPHTWSLTSGSLPGTLSLTAAGLLSGAGTTSSGSGTLEVTDAFGRSASWTVDLSRFPPGCP